MFWWWTIFSDIDSDSEGGTETSTINLDQQLYENENLHIIYPAENFIQSESRSNDLETDDGNTAGIDDDDELDDYQSTLPDTDSHFILDSTTISVQTLPQFPEFSDARPTISNIYDDQEENYTTDAPQSLVEGKLVHIRIHASKWRTISSKHWYQLISWTKTIDN